MLDQDQNGPIASSQLQSDEPKEARIEIGRPSNAMPIISKMASPKPYLKIVSTVILCMVSSIAAVWLLLTIGLVKPDITKTITQNGKEIVLQQGQVISNVFKEVNPSTVAVTTQGVTTDQFFGTSSQVDGAGSGIVISKDGYILTNKHVVPDGTSSVTVILANGQQYTNVQVVGRDPSNDIAFLKIQGVNNLTPANIGDSSTVQPGQTVAAIGNALGQFRNSITSGIISGIGRPIQASDSSGSSEQLEDLIQTDAAINPGNSGGPLVDLNGNVIGINTAVAEQSQGIGFAIPINDVKEMINAVLNQGKIVKPYLGVRYVTLSAQTAQQLGISQTEGAYVDGDSTDPAVVSGGPADKAGIRQGDVITKVDDTTLSESLPLATALAQFQPGDTIKLTVIRGGQTLTASVMLQNYPGL